MSSSAEEKTTANAGPEFGIQRIYVKDFSFESPNSPHIFRENSNWQPEVNLDLQSKSTKLDDFIFEVVLSLTVTVKSNEKIAFLAEVHHAGIFILREFPSEQLHHMLGSFCPSIIFPYARERISDVVNSGGFPQIYLAPINFDAVYQHQLQQKQAQAGTDPLRQENQDGEAGGQGDIVIN